MKKTVLALVLAVVSSGAWAKWVKVFVDDGVVYYVDPTTIRTDGDLRRAWQVIDWSAVIVSEEKESWRMLDEYDCKESKRRTLTGTRHSGPMASGRTLGSMGNLNWKYIPPETAGAALMKFVCAR